jgi:hypothetical protein
LRRFARNAQTQAFADKGYVARAAGGSARIDAQTQGDAAAAARAGP